MRSPVVSFVFGAFAPLCVAACSSSDSATSESPIDASSLDAAKPDSPAEAAAADSSIGDSANVDAGNIDSGSIDSGSIDSGSIDSGSIDSGSIDSGSIDSGSIDSGSIDSGSIDSGSIDSGSVDSGSVDSGSVDSGSDTGSPQKIPARVAMGSGHACLLRPDGDVMCWGNNLKGQVGQGDNKADAYPTPVLVPGLHNIVEIGVGNEFTCAKSTNGKVYCWGYNLHGQLGIGQKIESKPVPVEVSSLSKVAHLSVGSSHVCASTEDGVLSCWGNNSDGRLGDGTTTSRDLPVVVASLSAVSTPVLGVNHSCALVGKGEVYCWGSNNYGQLGQGDKTTRSTPAKVSDLSNVTNLALGGYFTCAQDNAAKLFCFGSNKQAQFGSTSAGGSVLSPQAVATPSPVKSLSAGLNHSCFVGVNAKTYCVGFNLTGQLGDGTLEKRSDWTEIAIVGTTQLSMGWTSSSALALDGSTTRLYVWGDNAQGQLGTGSAGVQKLPISLAVTDL